jgi:hypothetical protein
VPEIKASQFTAWLSKRLQADTQIVREAALETCLWGEAAAVKRTNAVDAVDQGQFKLSWNHGAIPLGAEVRNDAPYAGVIERGRRPGRPGPPLAPILAWVNRKLKGEIRQNYRFAKRLALGLAGAKQTPKARAQARRDVRAAFGTEAQGVDQGALQAARTIRDAIHARGTKPRWILRDTMREMKPRFKREALRRLRSRKR